ncbi:uncharacterized protein [Rutidosis leptorrhynchoides]|uniref:uncharacterized protein n=1 Tax=Rutidosis leptorrhynchoides TaxID=125765 RepID=UPI003A99F672
MNLTIYFLGRNLRSDALYRIPGTSINEQGSGLSSSPSDAPCRRPDMMLNERGFPHIAERVWIKKLVPSHTGVEGRNIDGYRKLRREGHKKVREVRVRYRKLRLGSWNVGTLTGKSLEIAEAMERKKVHILCLQETKWTGQKSRMLGKSDHKLWYSGKYKNMNGVGIVVDKSILDDVIEVQRYGDRAFRIKLMMGKDVLHVISAYAPQVGLSDSIKQEFWDSMDVIMQSVPNGEKVIIGGDLNGHEGKDRDGYDDAHGGYVYGSRNKEGESILDFASAYDLVIPNTCFQKRDSHLVTYKNGRNLSQIDFFLTRRRDRQECKDCKVIPGETLTTQHRLLVLDTKVRQWKQEKGRDDKPKIRWWSLKETKLEDFKKSMTGEDVWGLNEDVNSMWEAMERCVKRVASSMLGVSKGKGVVPRGSWWWDEATKEKIKEKSRLFRSLPKSQDANAYE